MRYGVKMNKKFLKLFIAVALLLSLSLVLASCDLFGKNKETDTPEEEEEQEVYVSSISISADSVPESAGAGLVDLSEIVMIVKKSDGTVENIPLKEDYLALAGRNKLNEVGLQQIEVLYEGCKTQFQITLVDPSITSYSLVVTGGIPVVVDGKEVSEKVDADGVFRAVYPSGTVVSIRWIPEENKAFDYWTKDDKMIDRQEETVVEMNGNYIYAAYSKDIVYSVSFITYKENFNIASKMVRKLYQSDIAEMTMDNYVFAGWTLSEISNDQALSGETFPLVPFDKISENRPTEKYFEVEKDVTFYAVWTPIKLSYSSYTDTASGESGYKIVGYSGTLSSLEIPSYYDGSKVLAIEKDAFKQNNAKLLQTVFIPETVVDIDEGAFRNCSSLVSFTVDSESKKFSSDGDVLYKNDRTILVAYPAGKVAAQYTLESNVTTISAYAFYGAVVGKVYLSKDVTSIGDYAFNSVHIDTLDFSGLRVSKLSSNKSYIGEGAFSDNLSCINVGNNEVVAYKAIDGFKNFTDRITDEGINSDLTHPLYIYKQGDVTLLYRLIDENNEAKYFNRKDQTAEIIGSSRSMTSLLFPNTVLYGNTSYTITAIGYYAFRDCIKLQEVKLPLYLERVGDLAFEDTAWKDTLNNYSIVENDTLYKYLGEETTYTLAESVTRIAEGAFAGNTKLQAITFNDVLVHIDAFAFDGCTRLHKIGGEDETFLIKKSLQKIGAYAFRNTAISDISSESNAQLVSVAEYAFENCCYLLHVSLDCPVLASVDTTAFLGDDSLLSYTVTEENGTYFSSNGILYTMFSKATAGLFLYPAGKMTAVLNPSADVKKYLSVTDDTFVLFKKEYLITETAGSYVGTEKTNSENTVTVRKDGEGYYLEPTITSLGENALHDSNIGALYIEKDVKSVYPVYVSGLLYVYLESAPTTYKKIFTETRYEPTYVKVGSEFTGLLSFFASDSELMNEKYTEKDFVFFTDSYLYYYENTASSAVEVTLIRSDRTATDLVVPTEVSVPDKDVATQKNIAPYSFAGWYLDSIVFEEGTESLQRYALENAYALKSIRFTETDADKIVSVHKESFGPYLNKGLLIYITDGLTQSYVDKWNEGETVLATFLYKYNSTEYYSSRYLIESEPFVTLCYFDDEDGSQKTVAKIFGSVYASDITSFRTVAFKNGYEVGGWTDYTEDERFAVVLGEEYTIPYNQVLVCDWQAKSYDVFLYVDAEYTLDAEGAVWIAEKSSSTTNVYKVSVEYNSDYKWSLRADAEQEKAETLTGWRLDGETVSTQGTWTTVLDNRTDEIIISAVLTKRVYTIYYGGDSGLSNSVAVSYDASYTLDVPTKTGYIFSYWYMTDETGTVVLTWSDGKSRNNWTITTSSNDTYTVLPAWVADRYDVTLYYYKGATEVPYKTVQVAYDGEDYVLDFDENEFSAHGEGEQYSIDKAQFFAGWADENEVIYTDSEGKALRKWDKSQPSSLYAVWPVEVTTFEQIQGEIEAKNTVSIVLMDDITVRNQSLCTLDVPYKGVFNGNGKKITYVYDDSTYEDINEDVYVGLFGCNEGTVKNIKMSATIVRNIDSIEFAEKSVYIGTVCAVNKGIMENVSVDVLSYSITVDTLKTRFYEISDTFRAGLVCAVDEGEIQGQCSYHYSKDTVYYRNATIEANAAFANGSWDKEYASYYIYDTTKGFLSVFVPFDATRKYYTVKEPEYASVTAEVVRNDAQKGYEAVPLLTIDEYSNQWDAFYQSLYIKNGDDMEPASDVYNSGETYYTYVDRWELNHSKYYILKGSSTFAAAPEVFDETLDYYIITEVQYQDATTAAKADAKDAVTWAKTYSQYYVYNDTSGQYERVSAPLENRDYYKTTGDIFAESRFHTGDIIYIDNVNK